MQDILDTYFQTTAALPMNSTVTDAAGGSIPIAAGFDRCIAMIDTLIESGGTLRFVGNGGSAAIASHMSVDFSKRAEIPAQALNDGSMLTCLSNDLGYDNVFAHQLSLHARPGDLLIAISSSGRSQNILNACTTASERGGQVITLSGFSKDNPLRNLGQLNFFVDSDEYGFVELTHFALLSALIDIKIGWRPGVPLRR